MPPRKAMPPPSPPSSGSGSESATSDEEEQQRPQKQQQKQAAQGKASPPPPQKKAAVPKQPQKTKKQQQAASPSPVKKKSVPNGEKKPPPPAPRLAAVAAAAAAAAADGDSSSDEEASDSPLEAEPAAKPAPFRSPLRGPKPASSAEPVGSSKPKEPPPPAAASHQLGKQKERKRQRQDVEDAEEGDAAAAAAAGGSSSKKQFQRLWTDENEVALLQGMLDFREKHDGTHPSSDMGAFSEFISPALGGFSRTQLHRKIRHLREKYERNRGRGQNGADPSFAKPHDQVTFDLSKRAWPAVEGDPITGVQTIKHKGWKRDRQGAETPCPMLAQAISLLEEEDGHRFLAKSARRALESLKPTEAKALEQQWNKHFMAEAKYYVERARLKKDLLQTLVKAVDTE